MLIFPLPGSVEGVVARRFDDGATVKRPMTEKSNIGGAAPARGIRNPAPGRPRVTVRAYYGALPSMAGRRCGRRLGESWPAEGVDPLSHIRKHGPGD